MPNLKIYADEKAARPLLDEPDTLLAEMRDILCRVLSTRAAACQLALIPVRGLAGQPAVNIELMILPTPARTRELLGTVAKELLTFLEARTGLQAAVRIVQLDPETYMMLK